MKTSLLHIVTFFLIIISLAGCLKSKDPGIPEGVRQTLAQAGVAKPDLMKTMLTFNSPNDSVKLRYSYFLIENLLSNYSIITSLVDKNDSVIDIDINKFHGYTDIKAYVDSLKNSSGNVKYIIDSIALDIDIVDSEFLVNHINSITEIIEKSSCQNDYNSDILMKYVLPYKVGNEAICPDISILNKKYSYLIGDSVANTSKRVSNLIDSIFYYDERLEIFSDVRPVLDLDSIKSGNMCEIATYKVMALRSLGIPAAMDYTPAFADSILNNYSVTVFLPGRKELHLKNSGKKVSYPDLSTPKVYRRTYESDTSSLYFKKGVEIHTPKFLGNYNYLDVTDHYFHTEDISMSFPGSKPGELVYIAVKNDNEFKPVHWSQCDSNGIAVFSNMVPDLKYYPVKVKGEKIVVQ